ncbi:hypothetical protein BJY04DRAFT_191071 [Aspergillus karnatakaensis]|uniref:60S acidic ribosomal protein P2 n=1 Tax=Aspergillus karnatakaensis TaxID=1810916 RepID=UPI003CCDFB01
MKHLAAYLLVLLNGTTTAPSATEIKEVLSSVGIEADEERLSHLLRELEGKDIAEVIAEGKKRLATFGGGSASKASDGEIGKDQVEEKTRGEDGEGGSVGGDADGDEDDEDFGLGLFG